MRNESTAFAFAMRAITPFAPTHPESRTADWRTLSCSILLVAVDGLGLIP